MTQTVYTPPAAQPQKPKRNTLLIVVIILLVICCLCICVSALGWQYGDSILRFLGISY